MNIINKLITNKAVAPAKKKKIEPARVHQKWCIIIHPIFNSVCLTHAVGFGNLLLSVQQPPFLPCHNYHYIICVCVEALWKYQ